MVRARGRAAKRGNPALLLITMMNHGVVSTGRNDDQRLLVDTTKYYIQSYFSAGFSFNFRK